jgi:hypothetical protein
VFSDISGEEVIHAGCRLDFRPVVHEDGERVTLDLDARITEPVGKAGFRTIRHRTCIVAELGKTVLLHLGTLPAPEAKGPDPKEEPVRLSVTLRRLTDR